MRQADPFVGYSAKVPICFERRFPSSHHRKFQVFLRLSKTTLPVLCRAALFIAPSSPQGARMAEWMVARKIPEGQHLSPSAGTSTRDALYLRVQKPSSFLVAPRATKCEA